MPRAIVIGRWVWALAKPGKTARPRPSIRSAVGCRATISAEEPMAATRSPSIRIAASWWTVSATSPVAPGVSWMRGAMAHSSGGLPSPELSSELLHLGPRLLRPASHVHLAVYRRRGGEVFPSLLATARAAVELEAVLLAPGAPAIVLKDGKRNRSAPTAGARPSGSW